MFEITLRRFLSKTPEIKTADPLKQHFPEDLYSFLKKKGFLQKEKGSLITLPASHNGLSTIKCRAKIKVEVLPGSNGADSDYCSDIPTTAELTISLKSPNGPNGLDEIRSSFCNKSWYAESQIVEGKPFEQGNWRSCPFSGLTDAQCAMMTPTVVNSIIRMLSKSKANEMNSLLQLG